MRLRDVPAIAALALSILVLAGCAAEPSGPSAPTPSASARNRVSSPAPTTTRTTDPLASVDGIQLNAETIDLRDGATVIRSLPLSDTSGTLTALTAVLGEPAVTVTTPDSAQYCTFPNTRYEWSNGLSILKWTSGEPPGYDVRLLSDHVTNASGSGRVTLTATAGVSVGEDIRGLIAKTPSALMDAGTSDGIAYATVILQQDYTDRTDTTGVAAFTKDGVVTAIGTPVPVHSNDDC